MMIIRCPHCGEKIPADVVDRDRATRYAKLMDGTRTAREVAEILGIHVNSANAIARKRGLSLRRAAPQPTPRPTKQLLGWLEETERGVTQRAIARREGISPGRVGYLLGLARLRRHRQQQENEDDR